MLFCPWDFPGKINGMGCHFLLQGNFPTQGSNPCLQVGRWILYHCATWEALIVAVAKRKYSSILGTTLHHQILKSLRKVENVIWNFFYYFKKPKGLQYTRLLCPSRSPRVCANSCPLSLWCHPATSSSVIPLCCLQKPSPWAESCTPAVQRVLMSGRGSTMLTPFKENNNLWLPEAPSWHCLARFLWQKCLWQTACEKNGSFFKTIHSSQQMISSISLGVQM